MPRALPGWYRFQIRRERSSDTEAMLVDGKERARSGVKRVVSPNPCAYVPPTQLPTNQIPRHIKIHRPNRTRMALQCIRTHPVVRIPVLSPDLNGIVVTRRREEFFVWVPADHFDVLRVFLEDAEAGEVGIVFNWIGEEVSVRYEEARDRWVPSQVTSQRQITHLPRSKRSCLENTWLVNCHRQSNQHFSPRSRGLPASPHIRTLDSEFSQNKSSLSQSLPSLPTISKRSFFGLTSINPPLPNPRCRIKTRRSQMLPIRIPTNAPNRPLVHPFESIRADPKTTGILRPETHGFVAGA